MGKNKKQKLNNGGAAAPVPTPAAAPAKKEQPAAQKHQQPQGKKHEGKPKAEIAAPAAAAGQQLTKKQRKALARAAAEKEAAAKATKPAAEHPAVESKKRPAPASDDDDDDEDDADYDISAITAGSSDDDDDDEDSEADSDEFSDAEPIFPPEVDAALNNALDELDVIEQAEEKELLALVQKYHTKRTPIYAKRNAAVREVDGFWPTVFAAFDLTSDMINEDKDGDLLMALEDFMVKYGNDPKVPSMTLEFTLAKNDVVGNDKIIVKLEAPTKEEMIVRSVTPMQWKKGHDLSKDAEYEGVFTYFLHHDAPEAAEFFSQLAQEMFPNAHTIYASYVSGADEGASDDSDNDGDDSMQIGSDEGSDEDAEGDDE